MPFNKINITLTPAQMMAIDDAITIIINTLPVKFNLTKEERISLPNINNERYPYVQRGIENHGPNNPNLVSGYAGTQAEATNDFVFYDQMKARLLRLRQAIEIYEDTQQVAGSEAYTWTRELYRSAKAAAANQVPGSDAVVDDLATLFEEQGGGTSTPPLVIVGIALPTNQTTPSTIVFRIAGNSLATGTKQFKMDWGDGTSTIGTLENGVLASYSHTYTTAGQFIIQVTAITAGALEEMDILQFDNCQLNGTITVHETVRPSGFQFPNNLVTMLSMQQASYTNLTSLVPYNNNMDASSVNEALIKLDNSGLLNGIANFGGGTNDAPSGAGITAMNNLIAKGWTVITN